MSGGVDSSVAAYLCTLEHDKCVGATMLLYLNEALGISAKHPCCSRENIIDARAVCERLGIEHEVLDYMNDFEERVIRKFVDVYEAGGTPNPCIDCNRFMKFDAMLKHAEAHGLDKIATGHYARTGRSPSGRYLLRKAVDLARDQSYVLYALTQEQLARTEFPLGGMTKPQVRDLAEAQGFVNARKHDSQDICFVPDGDYSSFIEQFTGRDYPPGKFVDVHGQVLGTHKGVIHYTTGQRRGLGVAAKSRLYVAAINTHDNTITLAAEGESELYARGVIVRDVNLVALESVPENLRARVKTRYRQREVDCVVNAKGDDELVIEFAERQRVPAAGQAAVIYEGDCVLAGGTIYATL